MINKKSISRRYPEAYKELELWITKKIESAFPIKKTNTSLDEEVKRAFGADKMIEILFSHPESLRNLYEFFDIYDVCLGIIGHSTTWTISISMNPPNPEFYKNRKEAEEAGFAEAFSILNKQLSN